MKTYLVMGAAAAAILLVLAASMLTWIPAGHVGVSGRGSLAASLSPGLHWHAPFAPSPATYSLSLGPVPGEAPLRCSDGSTYKVIFEVSGRLDPARAPAFHEVAADNGVERVLTQGAGHGIAGAAASRPPEALATGELLPAARAEAARLLDHVGVTDVQLSLRLESPESLLNLARTLARQGRGGLVRPLAEAALEGGSRTWETHTALGLAKEAERDLRGAESAYLDALSLLPTALPPMAELVRIYTSVEEYDKLERLLSAALEVDPTSAAHLTWLGGTYMRRGSLEQAEALFLRALERDAGNTVILNNLGGVYLMRGRGGEAVEIFRRAVTAAPGDRQSLYNLGVALSAQGDHEEGLRYLLEAERIDPGRKAVLEAVAAAYRGLGRRAEADRWERREREAPADGRSPGP